MAYCEILPFTAYHADDHGTNHYYLQLPDCVIHINRECDMINRLYAGHLKDNPRKLNLHEIPMDDYLAVAGEVLDHLGFAFFPTDPLSPLRHN